MENVIILIFFEWESFWTNKFREKKKQEIIVDLTLTRNYTQ